MAITQVEVFGEFVGAGGDPQAGVRVELVQLQPFRDGAAGALYPPATFAATSGADGLLSVMVPSPESPDAQPQGVLHRLTVRWPEGGAQRKLASVPDVALVSVFDLLAIEPGDPGDGNVGPPGPQGPRGIPGIIVSAEEPSDPQVDDLWLEIPL